MARSVEELEHLVHYQDELISILRRDLRRAQSKLRKAWTLVNEYSPYHLREQLRKAWSPVDATSNPDLVYLSTRQYCELRGIRPNTARIERMRGSGPPYVRTGAPPSGHVRYKLTDVLEWMESRKARSTAEEFARPTPEKSYSPYEPDPNEVWKHLREHVRTHNER